jgi:hypothetical protein
MDTVLLVHQGHQWIRGSERFLIDHIAQLDRSRFRPILWTNNQPLADAVDIPVVVDRFSSLFAGSPPRHDVTNFLRLLHRTRELIRRYDVRLIHCNAPEPCQWVIPASGQLPVVLHVHWECGLRLRVLSLTHRSSALIGASRAMLRSYRQDGYEGPTHVVYNSIDPQRLTSQAKVDIGVEGPVVLSVGFLVHVKGFDRLIEAFRPHADRATLVIAGDGPERDRLERQARGLPVRFLGSRSDVGALMRDVGGLFVLPSREEAFGLVLVEAGLFGLPCIATNVGGVSEVLVPGTGLLVKPDELSAAIGRLLDSPAEARELGGALQQRVLREFVAPRSTRLIESIYVERILGGGQRAGWRPYARIARRVIGRPFCVKSGE